MGIEDLLIHCDPLEDALNRHDAVISSFSKRLDDCSERIKKVESYLQEKHINFDFKFPTDAEIDGIKDITIKWAKIGERWRVVLSSPGLPEGNQERPLSDAKSHIRAYLTKYLPEFLAAISAEVSGHFTQKYTMKDAREFYIVCQDIVLTNSDISIPPDSAEDIAYQRNRQKALTLKGTGAVDGVILKQRFAANFRTAVRSQCHGESYSHFQLLIVEELDRIFCPLFDYLEFGESPKANTTIHRAAGQQSNSLDSIPF
jgi:hypothetical protein